MRRLAPLGLAVGALALASFAGAQDSSSPPDGLVVERVRLPRAPRVAAGDRILTVVRVDLARYRLAVLSSLRDGPPRPLDRWVADHHLAGGINAGMFLPNRRPVGTLVDRGEVLSDRNPGRFDGIIGWDPRGRAGPIAAGGAGCPAGRAGILGRYASAVQGFRMMVDCQGRARPWPTRRIYSAAAFGRDADGRAVFLHTRTPYPMGVLNEMLVELRLGIRGLVYMEGGPEASLVVRDGPHQITEMGSWEDGFWENDGNDRLWDLPTVIGFQRR
ncbi:MAG: phosphodiester glycosidase family protein [Sandaracinaceae bacterium]|nr:phosphodiester glycosidase family protein [Sandaracinaceae bacterium]